MTKNSRVTLCSVMSREFVSFKIVKMWNFFMARKNSGISTLYKASKGLCRLGPDTDWLTQGYGEREIGFQRDCDHFPDAHICLECLSLK